MKKNIRNVQILGIGVLTPALMGQPQAAMARSIDSVEAVQFEPGSAATATLQERANALIVPSIFVLSPEENLRITRPSNSAAREDTWKMVGGEHAGGCHPNIGIKCSQWGWSIFTRNITAVDKKQILKHKPMGK